MTSRDLIRTALEHRDVGRVPVDFGSTGVTGMHCSVVAALRDHFDLESHPVKVHEPYQMLGLIEEDLKACLGIDTDGLFPRRTMFGFPLDGWKPWVTPWGQEVLVPDGFVTETEPGGSIVIFPEGDESAAPSGRMPAASYFFDTIVRQEDFDEDHLDVQDNQEEFGPIKEENLAYLRTVAEALKNSSRAVVANFGGTGFGDIAVVPAPFLKRPRGIRDIEEWYVSTVSRQEYIHEIFAYQCDYALQNLEKIREVVGDIVDVIFICGTDFGTQSSSFCSVDTLESLYCPYYKRVNEWIHERTAWKTFKHSCGAVEPFISSFIEAGFDILNPVQCSAAGMDPRTLKAKYGDRIVFWGGGVDTQKTLPFGTPDKVRTEVLERCSVFSAGGGYVFDSVHNIQARTPVENVVAMFDAVGEFNGG